MARKENKADAKTISANHGPDNLCSGCLPLAVGHYAVTSAAAVHFQFYQVDIMLCTSQIRDFD